MLAIQSFGFGVVFPFNNVEKGLENLLIFHNFFLTIRFLIIRSRYKENSRLNSHSMVFFNFLPAGLAVADRLDAAVPGLPGKQPAFKVFPVAGHPALQFKRFDTHPVQKFFCLFILLTGFIKNDNGLKMLGFVVRDKFSKPCRRTVVVIHNRNVFGIRN